MRFTVPGRAVSKHRPRTVQGRNGTRTFTPRSTKDFERDVAFEAKAARVRRIPGAVRIVLRFFDGHGDWDNLAKAICDALNGIAYDDDRQIVEAHVYLTKGEGKPRTEVEVSPAFDDDACGSCGRRYTEAS